MIIGIDEVGRGSWAGPLLIVAARPVGDLPASVMDSKLLAKSKRQKLFFDIILACEIGEGWVSPSEIDNRGLSQAMRLGVKRALKALRVATHEQIIIDGHINYCAKTFVRAKAVIDADAIYPVVSAASIVAKVKRDEFMTKAAEQFPYYGFERHVGYGTRLHQERLKAHGICEIHRRSYRPVKAYI